jgi:hypothetical protein
LPLLQFHRHGSVQQPFEEPELTADLRGEWHEGEDQRSVPTFAATIDAAQSRSAGSGSRKTSFTAVLIKSRFSM